MHGLETIKAMNKREVLKAPEGAKKATRQVSVVVDLVVPYWLPDTDVLVEVNSLINDQCNASGSVNNNDIRARGSRRHFPTRVQDEEPAPVGELVEYRATATVKHTAAETCQPIRMNIPVYAYEGTDDETLRRAAINRFDQEGFGWVTQLRIEREERL